MCHVLVFGWFVSQITAIPDYKPAVPGPDQLGGMKVATKKDTTSAKRLVEIGADVTQTVTIEESYAKLVLGNVKAVVFDSPSIMYYSTNDGRGRVIYGKLSNREYYGFMLPQNSPFRETINGAVLELQKEGRLRELQKKWFGENDG